MDAKAIAIIAVVAVAPLAIVFIIALLRGYKIDIRLSRGKKTTEESDE